MCRQGFGWGVIGDRMRWDLGVGWGVIGDRIRWDFGEDL